MRNFMAIVLFFFGAIVILFAEFISAEIDDE
jgi:hypothetical protein